MTDVTTGIGLILGGARSGKSAFAEQLANNSNRRKLYLATSEAFDDEMNHRIRLHQQRRGPEWQLIEEPLEIGRSIASMANENSVVLVDCLTLWLTNLMMLERNVDQERESLVAVLRELSDESSVLLVSNEVGQGIVPMEKLARDFRDQAGRIHQEIAAVADHVWFVTAGLPQKLK